MKVKELRELNELELGQKLKEFQEKLLELNSQNVLGRLKNPLQIRQFKRDIACVKTILNEHRQNKGSLESQESKEPKSLISRFKYE